MKRKKITASSNEEIVTKTILRLSWKAQIALEDLIFYLNQHEDVSNKFFSPEDFNILDYSEDNLRHLLQDMEYRS